MSHHTLQKLTVRMFYDETFAAAVYEDAAKALAGLDLTDAERAQLIAVDRRAWRHDALRQRRTLRTLAEEYKISTTIVLAETRSLAALERFFASPCFHRALQQRGSLAMAFAEFLLDGCHNNKWVTEQLPDVIRLEKTFAACRRALERESATSSELPQTIHDRMRVKLAPGCDVAAFEANVIATVQHVEKYLFELSLMPAMALCDDAPRLTGLPPVARPEKVWLLFSPGATGISLTHLDKASYQVLNETRQPIAIRNLIARPGATKAAAQQAQEVLSDWLEGRVLMLVE